MSSTRAKSNYHHGDLKQALLTETARILREEGEDALSLRRMAASLGVSRTAPYNHFDSKEKLLQAIAEEGFARLSDAIVQARSASHKKDGRSVTRALVKAYVSFARDHQEYYDQMYSSKAWKSDTPSSSLSSAARNVLRTDIERLQRAQQRGLIAADINVVQFSQMYWGTVHGISRLLLDGVYSDPTSVNTLCEATADMLWQQLEPAATAHQ